VPPRPTPRIRLALLTLQWMPSRVLDGSSKQTRLLLPVSGNTVGMDPEDQIYDSRL